MIEFPLSISEVGLWLAITAIILLITSELLFSASSSLGDIIIERDRLRLVAIGVGLAFMTTVIIRIIQNSCQDIS